MFGLVSYIVHNIIINEVIAILKSQDVVTFLKWVILGNKQAESLAR